MFERLNTFLFVIKFIVCHVLKIGLLIFVENPRKIFSAVKNDQTMPCENAKYER